MKRFVDIFKSNKDDLNNTYNKNLKSNNSNIDNNSKDIYNSFRRNRSRGCGYV